MAHDDSLRKILPDLVILIEIDAVGDCEADPTVMLEDVPSRHCLHDSEGVVCMCCCVGVCVLVCVCVRATFMFS